MKKSYKQIALWFVFVVSLLAAGMSKTIFTEKEKKPYYLEMEKAASLASEWFETIHNEKVKMGVVGDEYKGLRYGGLMGLEYSYITTTLGSVEAKQTAINPEFAALTYRWLKELGIDSTSTIGVNISGSFPSLSIAVLAAIQSLGAYAVLISSIGASSFGANDTNATWLDIEKWLIKKSGLKYKSVITTPGGINDNGGGLQPEGIEQIKEAAKRCMRELFIPADLNEAADIRIKTFSEHNVNVLINIGGNHPSLGSCSHSWQIPNGLIKDYTPCKDKGRSFLFHFIEKDVPVIHFLNIKEIAATYGFPISPVKVFNKPVNVYYDTTMKKTPVVVSVLVILTSLFLLSEKKILRRKKSNEV